MARKAQIKMFETIGVLVIFFFLLVAGAAFYFQVQKSAIQSDIEKQEQLKAFQVVQKALFLPELDCSVLGIQKDNCFDKFKVSSLGSYLSGEDNEDFLIDYFNVFGFSEIRIYQVYPEGQEFSHVLYKNIPREYSSMLKTQSPVLLYDAVRRSYDFGVIEVDVYAE